MKKMKIYGFNTRTTLTIFSPNLLQNLLPLFISFLISPLPTLVRVTRVFLSPLSSHSTHPWHVIVFTNTYLSFMLYYLNVQYRDDEYRLEFSSD